MAKSDYTPELICDPDLPAWHKSKFRYIINKDRRKTEARAKWNGKRRGDPQLPFTLESKVRPVAIAVATGMGAATFAAIRYLLH